MLNLLWGAMMLIGILYGAVTGRFSEVTDAALSCAKEAVALCITMSGIVAMWMGIIYFPKYQKNIRQWNIFPLMSLQIF